MSKNIAMILGSGFSCEFGLPSTKGLSAQFLKFPERNGDVLDNAISRVLKEFWKDVFGYKDDSATLPSLEDHFTLLDLAANSGHHLGKNYPPKKLRAIRRMSIHRVFQILDSKYESNDKVECFMKDLCGSLDVSIVTLNWDIVIEKLLKRRAICYGTSVEWLPGSEEGHGGKIPLLKMHGSSNWMYCDSCHQIHAGLDGKSALHAKAFLELDDFSLFEISSDDRQTIEEKLNGDVHSRCCRCCGNRLAGRLATFSYTKAFSINQFQTIWEQAHATLRKANTWLFIGYSMPQADYEFKHLLKSAQLGRGTPENWSSEVILEDDDQAEEQYKRFFGNRCVRIAQRGLSKWIDEQFKTFIDEKSRNVGQT